METATVPLRPAALGRAVGISKTHASHVINGIKPPTKALAIRIFRATGHKLGPIADASDAEIAILERFEA